MDQVLIFCNSEFFYTFAADFKQILQGRVKFPIGGIVRDLKS